MVLTRHVVSDGRGSVYATGAEGGLRMRLKVVDVVERAPERETRDATSTRLEGAEEGAKLRRTDLPNSERERESLVESGK